ncbi:hypothetical protein [Ichthyenterobacterium magnum]|uniref:Uncharacterized protein n=1 Tax=Ichthyenterobacterium magnum TaxID=1230530 RepID=A0A420DXP1_9FLAO|nr:hypothetical protein [Ichthyenterobacterium magnum]RKE98983.1 hypothetical protein BXY80_1081 [Ichthyenterobacterium magnum]
MGKKKDKRLKKERLLNLSIQDESCTTIKYKSKCCKKYKKSEAKRCKKCPCFDLIKKVA